MTSASTWRSLAEPPTRQHIGDLFDQRLLLGSTTPQREETHLPPLEVHLRTHQAMLPQRLYHPDATQQLDFPLPVAATQEDQPSLRLRLQVQTPVLREGATKWCCVDSRRCTLPMGHHIAGRLRLQPLQRRVLKPRPHLSLPQTVKALDGSLEARLSGRDIDGDDSQAQADAGHATNGVRVDLRSLEERVIVELRVVGQANCLPVLHQRFHHERGRNCRRMRPGYHQTAMQRDAVENLDLDAPTNDQPFDQIEAVQLGTPVGNPRQVPARTRWWTPDSPAAVQR